MAAKKCNDCSDLKDKVNELTKLLERAKDTIIQSEMRINDWKALYNGVYERLVAYESDSAAVKLKQERDFWKERYMKSVSRIAVLLEHQGNVDMLERENATLLAALEYKSVRVKRG